MSIYTDQVMSDAPVAYWRLGDGGNPTADSSGHGNTSALTTITSGQVGALVGDSNAAIKFTTSSSSTTTISSPATLNAPFSVEAWVKLTTLPVATQYAILGTREPADFAFTCSFQDVGLTGVIGTGSGWISTTLNYNFTAVVGVWYHIVYTIGTTAWVIYLNGAQVATNTLGSTGLLWDATHIPGIGCIGSTGGAFFMDGTMDEIAVYPSVLLASRVLAHYNAGINPVQPLPPSVTYAY